MKAHSVYVGGVWLTKRCVGFFRVERTNNPANGEVLIASQLTGDAPFLHYLMCLEVPQKLNEAKGVVICIDSVYTSGGLYT